MFRHRLRSSTESSSTYDQDEDTVGADVTQINLKHDNPSFLKEKKGTISDPHSLHMLTFWFKCVKICLIILGTSTSQGSSRSSVCMTSCLTLDKERRVRGREISQNKMSVVIIQPS